MFEGFFKSKFNTKSKSAIKITKSRIEIIKRKRNATEKFLKNDIVDLLKYGFDVNAYGRVEGLWNEMNISICYDFIEQFCNHVSSHLTQMNKQRECPDDCREAVCSLMYAAARFADLPELRDLRNLFLQRYGSSIECYVNKEFVNKFKSKPPSKDTKLQLMLDIATEFGFEWNAKSLEQKLFKHPIYGHDYNKNSDDVQSLTREPLVDDKIDSHYDADIDKPVTKIESDLRKDDDSVDEKPSRLKKWDDDDVAKEEIMDRLLLHYSIKKQFDNNNNSNTGRNGIQTRTKSFCVEPSRVDNDDDDSRGHARTRSLQPEMLNSNGGHVHPKLPDYDDFVARLAALRSSM